MFKLDYEWNEMKYVWTNEADYVFDKVDSLVEVPYVEPPFLGNLNVNSMIPMSRGIPMKWYEQRYVLYELWYVLCVRCYVLCAIW